MIEQAEQFLERHGWGDAERRPLAGDAGTRRYERLSKPGSRETRLLVHTPDLTAHRRFQQLSRYFDTLGVSVPKRHGDSPGQGLALIEDFGDAGFRHRLEGGFEEGELYGAAVDWLAALHRKPHPVSLDLPRYEAGVLCDQIAPFIRDFLPKTGITGTAQELISRLREVLEQVVDPTRLVLIHRDFHADNLFWLPDRDGLARCAIIDYQDAALAPASYDLVSLLKDARRRMTPELEHALIARYLNHPDQAHIDDRRRFAAQYAAVGLVRNLRITGIFMRLAQAGKTRYLTYLPLAWSHVQDHLADPVLADVKDWFSGADNAAWVKEVR